jgi:hypothetical protein
MIMRRIAVLLICLIPLALSAEDRSQVQDGIFWNGLTRQQKVYFVEGYANGFSSGQVDLLVALSNQNVKTNREIMNDAGRNMPSAITFGALVNGVDKCYSDFRNSRLNVEFCLDWTVRGIKGDGDSDRENYLAKMRRFADASRN